MNKKQLHIESLFDGEKLLHKQTIEYTDNIITSIQKGTHQSEYLSGMLVAGFIDIQVNGGGGYLFNESPTYDAIKKIARAHQSFGTTGWLPTLVTDSYEKMLQAAQAVVKALNDKSTGVVGIHFEGPCLSVEKKGVHLESFIRELSQQEMTLFKRQDLGKVIVTLAPESVSEQQIVELVKAGVIVCLGHSNASFEQTNRALKAGATGFTHLFNAMSAFTSREPGMVGAALLDKKSYAGLILDGIHVHPDSARLAVSCKQNIMLVTDAMPPVGSNKSEFEFFGKTIKRDGFKLTDAKGRLAGSAIDMMSCVNNFEKMLGLSFTQGVNLASLNPATFLGLNNQYGSLTVGKKANMVLIKNRKVVSSWINGVKVI